MYSNQAKTLFGRKKIVRQKTQKIDTEIIDQLPSKRAMMHRVYGVLTECCLRNNALSPEVDQYAEEHGLAAEDRGPS
jgi:hypothetical protein